MAQWAHLGRARAPFHLYVPAGSVDIARRLATENQVNVAEIWSFHTIGDQTRFTLVHRSAPEVKRAAAERVGRRGRQPAGEPAAPQRGRKAAAGDAREGAHRRRRRRKTAARPATRRAASRRAQAGRARQKRK